MRSLKSTIAATIAIASLCCHLSTFIARPIVPAPAFGILHVATMAIFFTMILSLQAHARLQPMVEQSGLFGRLRASNQQSRDFQARVLSLLPPKAGLLCVATFLYACVNFGIFMMQVEGSTAQKDGQYYLHNHGTKIRDITVAEAQQHRRLVTRGFSGHWLLFSTLPAVYFYFVEQRLRNPPTEESTG